MKSQRRNLLSVFLLFFASGIFVVFFARLNARITAEEHVQNLKNQAQHQAEKRAYYSSLTPLEALEHCRTRWNAELSWSHYYLPQAVGYSRTGVDAYYLQGVDTKSLRHFRCTADGELYKGYRYERFGMEYLPAEAAIDHAAQAQSVDWTRDALSKLEMTADFFAAEFLMAPDAVLLRRTWRGAETLQSQLTPEGRDFPLLLHDPALFGVKASAFVPLQATSWQQHPQAAFALLRRELPVDAKILTLDLSHNEIDITIAGPIAGFDNDPPSPSGDMQYDEYGIADRSWWYPRPLLANDCKAWQSLEDVIAEFDRSVQANDPTAALVYRCGWRK